jgi:hypothetical protein
MLVLAIRHARLDLNEFQVLVGPNASGKSTLLDALTLVRDILTVGIDRALRGDARFDIPQRVADPHDLTWMRSGGAVEIALTFDLPDDVKAALGEPFTRARYECGVDVSDEPRFSAEKVHLGRRTAISPCPRRSFTSSSLRTRKGCSSTGASDPAIHARSSMGDRRGPTLSDHGWG